MGIRTNWYKVSFVSLGDVLELDTGKDSEYTIQHSEYTKNHWSTHFNMVMFMLRELQHNVKK